MLLARIDAGTLPVGLVAATVVEHPRVVALKKILPLHRHPLAAAAAAGDVRVDAFFLSFFPVCR